MTLLADEVERTYGQCVAGIEPSVELLSKARRKALLTALAHAKRDAMGLRVSIMDAEIELTDSPERLEILTDWVAGVAATESLIDDLRKLLDAAAP